MSKTIKLYKVSHCYMVTIDDVWSTVTSAVSRSWFRLDAHLLKYVGVLAEYRENSIKVAAELITYMSDKLR